VCDGLAMNHEGMNYSLVSRESSPIPWRSWSRRTPWTAWCLFTNCDKIVPGMLMAAARLDVPVVVVTGGPMLAGDYQGGKVSLSNIFEAWASTSRERCPRTTWPTGGTPSVDLRVVRRSLHRQLHGCVCGVSGLVAARRCHHPAPYSARLTLARQSGVAAVEVTRKAGESGGSSPTRASRTPWR